MTRQASRAEMAVAYWRSELAERTWIAMKRGESRRHKRARARAARRLDRILAREYAP